MTQRPEPTLIPEGDYSGLIESFREPTRVKSEKWAGCIRLTVVVAIHGYKQRVYVTWVGFYPAMLALLQMREHFLGSVVNVRIRHKEFQNMILIDGQLSWPKGVELKLEDAQE